MRSSDHPRACGEHPKHFGASRNPFGSSPRLRGTRQGGCFAHGLARIIPAPAGNTMASYRSPIPMADHPRACGEHSLSKLMPTPPCGSSPRLRGTPRVCGLFGLGVRIIPAPAGNTPGNQTQDRTHSDHSRACGEHGRTDRPRPEAAGSFPRLRGTLNLFPERMEQARIIPAPAGNTWRNKFVGKFITDHSRACGEHSWRNMLN